MRPRDATQRREGAHPARLEASEKAAAVNYMAERQPDRAHLKAKPALSPRFAGRDFMLTLPEMTDARDSLRQAEGLTARVRGVYLSAGYIQGARILNDVLRLLAAPACRKAQEQAFLRSAKGEALPKRRANPLLRDPLQAARATDHPQA